MPPMGNFFRGEVSRDFLVRIWYPAAMAVLFSGIALSLYFFPGPFDWRYRVVSSLISQIDNPEGNRYFCAGLALTCFMLIPLAGFFRARLATYAPKTATFSFHALRVGLVFSVIVGLERLFFRNLSAMIHKAHEYIALVAFTGLFLGVVGFWLASAWRLQKQRPVPVWALGLIFLTSGAPMIGAALSQAYLYFVPNQLGWVGPHWAALGVPLYLSFAFWEWIASAAVFTYLFLILYLLPESAPTNSAKARTARRRAS